MDPDAVFERADVTRHPGDLFPRGSDETKWVATDPETGCRGVGTFEKGARANLVYAVEAYHENPDSEPYVSSGSGQTFEMRWLDDEDATLADRLQSLFSL